MFKIENNTIHITRGDAITIEVKAKSDNEHYVFKTSDVIRLNIFKTKDCSDVLFTKDYNVESESTSVDISLNSEETTIGELINKPKKYWYELILNPGLNEQTIVGYDMDGPKEIILYPEAEESD